MVFNTTFNNISVVSWQSSFIGGGNRSTRRKLPYDHDHNGPVNLVYQTQRPILLQWCLKSNLLENKIYKDMDAK
jgi:hypothetical protein